MHPFCWHHKCKPRFEGVRSHVYPTVMSLGDLTSDERLKSEARWSTSSAGVPLELADSYAHWLELHFNQNGRIH